MAIYKLFPSQDATLYSLYPLMNTGLDAILEASNKLGSDGAPNVARYLIQFDNTEILDVINNKISGSSYDIYLKNFVSEVQGINQDTTLELRTVAQSWNNGTGYTLDNPMTSDGASWGYSTYINGNPWSVSGNTTGGTYTSSYSVTYASQGGGNWFTSSNYLVTTSFGLRSTKDIELNVKTIVNAWSSSTIINNGFIVKLSDSSEFNSSEYVQPIFKYYSVDTNTIYPPTLEFRWNDYKTVLTGSATASLVNTVDLKMSLAENPGEFFPESINRFYINVSPLYPTRTYQTSSLFTNLNYLPTSSYYAIKDLDTNEFVVNFDTTYTKISSDANGNYFTVYMSGLEPERYYKVLIKTIINGSTIIFDDNYYFKVING
jgi:hypothetical protein